MVRDMEASLQEQLLDQFHDFIIGEKFLQGSRF
jgi:hypothetical protein